jgi:hypothetical protein
VIRDDGGVGDYDDNDDGLRERRYRMEKIT